MTSPASRPGRFLCVDAEGYLVNDTSLEAVPTPWRGLLDESLAVFRAALGQALHSVWVRGSAVSGQVVLGVSDLDLVALADLPADKPGGLWLTRPELTLAEASLTAPGCTGVELAVASLPAVPSERGDFLRFLLATQACRLHGRALSLPRHRPDVSICFVSRHVPAALRTARRERAQVLQDGLEVARLVHWLGKTLIRAGLELDLARHRRYARDLWPCTQIFVEHHPERRDVAMAALEATLSPGRGVRELDFLVDEVGSWLVDALVAAGRLPRPVPGV